jgi:6-pyruvoyltetrahydropterin/6-carboxytetrahydropterin synthase
MFRLTREVRFAVNSSDDVQLGRKPTNSYGGFPTLTTLGRYYTLRVTLAGELEPDSSYLRNIKEIDEIVRGRVIGVIAGWSDSAERLLCDGIYPIIKDAWQPDALDRLELMLTPLLSLSLFATESPMVRLTQKFEFSASHRLHNPSLTEQQNRERFGKCNNPQGHGHNYELAVTLTGDGRRQSLLERLPEFERIVAEEVIERFDHKNLNVEVGDFRELIPTVENIAMVIFRKLRPRFDGQSAQLASVTVWETPKTWCEYFEVTPGAARS